MVVSADRRRQQQHERNAIGYAGNWRCSCGVAVVRRTDYYWTVDGMNVRLRIIAEYEFEVSNGFHLRATRQRFDEAVARVLPAASWSGSHGLPGKLVQLATEQAAAPFERKEFNP